MNEELRTELLARADRDQTARKSLPPALRAQQWEQVIEPVDRANTARMREIVAGIRLARVRAGRNGRRACRLAARPARAR